MLSLLLRNLFFTILQPGLVAGAAPYFILGQNFSKSMAQQWQPLQYVALIVFAIGLIILFSCVLRFAVEGRGTISPVDPTKKLVIGGLYRFSRNPMYMGVMLILIGEALFFQSTSLWIYVLVILLAFHIFILLHEEPRLRKAFGKEYIEYCKKVRRWI